MGFATLNDWTQKQGQNRKQRTFPSVDFDCEDKWRRFLIMIFFPGGEALRCSSRMQTLLHDVLLNILYQFQQQNHSLMYLKKKWRNEKFPYLCLFASGEAKADCRHVSSAPCYFLSFVHCTELKCCLKSLLLLLLFWWNAILCGMRALRFSQAAFHSVTGSFLVYDLRRGTFTRVRNDLCTKKSGEKCQINKDPILSARTSQGGLLTLALHRSWFD